MARTAARLRAREQSGDVAAATRDLILVLADSKRLLGTRYAEWLLGAPELEAGIACASMAQDEWGHARLLYALLKDFGDDVDKLEHGRTPDAYCNIEILDRPAASWGELVVWNALLDTALSVQLDALRESSHAPLRQRVGKLLDEEQFHAAHGVAWLRRLTSGTAQARAQMSDAVAQALPIVLRWFGSDAEQRGRMLLEAGVVDAIGSTLRTRYLSRVGAVLNAIHDTTSLKNIEPDFSGFDEASRRVSKTGPDAETIARVRGDKNRAFLVD